MLQKILGSLVDYLRHSHTRQVTHQPFSLFLPLVLPKLTNETYLIFPKDANANLCRETVKVNCLPGQMAVKIVAGMSKNGEPLNLH